MKIFRISARELRLLDHEFAGTLCNALTEVAHSGHEPEIRVERTRPDPHRPSTWTLIVSGDGIERRFPTETSVIATAIAVLIHASDFADDLRADVRSRTHDSTVQASLDDCFPWLRRKSQGLS